MNSTNSTSRTEPASGTPEDEGADDREAFRALVLAAIEERKGRDVTVLDVAPITDIADTMVIVSGTSNRHVRAVVDNLIEVVKSANGEILGVEGRETHEWVLVDLGDIIVHVMQAEARRFYDLERLWEYIPDTERIERQRSPPPPPPPHPHPQGK